MEHIQKLLNQVGGESHSRSILSGNLWVGNPYFIVPSPWMPDYKFHACLGHGRHDTIPMIIKRKFYKVQSIISFRRHCNRLPEKLSPLALW
ncbi:MAG: hypothetical protein ABIL68_12670, partial [bacterium]